MSLIKVTDSLNSTVYINTNEIIAVCEPGEKVRETNAFWCKPSYVHISLLYNSPNLWVRDSYDEVLKKLDGCHKNMIEADSVIEGSKIAFDPTKISTIQIREKYETKISLKLSIGTEAFGVYVEQNELDKFINRIRREC